MRLTDLVRDRKTGKKHETLRSALSEDMESDDSFRHDTGKKEGPPAGHLQAGDLSSIYDIGDAPAGRNDVPDVSEPLPVQGFPPPVDIPLSGRDRGSVSRSREDVSRPDSGDNVRESGIPFSSGAEQRKPTGRISSGGEIAENREEQELADTLHIELLAHLDDIYDEGREGEEIYLERLIAPLAQTIELSRTSNTLLRKAVRLKKGQRSFTTHSLNVGILAVKIGLTRNYSDERIFSLALCALLGDIGMTRVDPAILSKAGKLATEEFTAIKRHVDYSVEIVNTVAHKFPFLAPIIYQLHERENGSGYPQGLKGANIHDFAKIIGMCDVYIALTEPKANREHYSGYVAMQQLISRRSIDFDAKVIKSLIDVISVFPLESLVRLNNGAVGRVIDISSVHPTRPKLSILINSDGEKLQRPLFLDLEKEPLLYIENPDIEEGVVL